MRGLVLSFFAGALALLGGCGGEGAAVRDPSLQRRNDLPAHTESSQKSEKGAQSISREPHSRASYAPKNGH